jgi:hypothetical protein
VLSLSRSIEENELGEGGKSIRLEYTTYSVKERLDVKGELALDFYNC